MRYLIVSSDSLQEAEVVTAVEFEEVPFLSWYGSEALQASAKTEAPRQNVSD